MHLRFYFLLISFHLDVLEAQFPLLIAFGLDALKALFPLLIAFGLDILEVLFPLLIAFGFDVSIVEAFVFFSSDLHVPIALLTLSLAI